MHEKIIGEDNSIIVILFFGLRYTSFFRFLDFENLSWSIFNPLGAKEKSIRNFFPALNFSLRVYNRLKTYFFVILEVPDSINIQTKNDPWSHWLIDWFTKLLTILSQHYLSAHFTVTFLSRARSSLSLEPQRIM